MAGTGDYLSFYTSISHLPPISVLAIFLLGMMRLGPIVAIVPFLGAKLPQGVKMGMLVSLTIVLLPQMMLTAHEAPTLGHGFIALALKEQLIGFIIAFLTSIPFYFAQGAGILIDFLRGSSSLQVNDPTMQNQSSPIGLLYNYILILIFFQINGLALFLNGIFDSYTFLPADKYISPLFFQLQTPFWQLILHLGTSFLAISIQLAAPCLVAVLMAEMFLGIANRLAPQVQIAFLGMAIKSLLGIALLWAGWFFILQQLAVQTLMWLEGVRRVLFTFSAY